MPSWGTTPSAYSSVCPHPETPPRGIPGAGICALLKANDFLVHSGSRHHQRRLCQTKSNPVVRTR